MTAVQGESSGIQRKFRDIPADAVLDMDEALVLANMGWSDTHEWAELLKSQRVLIISEAGAGKTFECRAQQKRLWDLGKPAFYVELATLAHEELRTTFDPKEEERFAAWQNSQSGTATFFLDSVDELKLTLGSFEQALKRIARAIGGNLARARIVITARPIPVDERAFRRLLPVPETETSASAEEFALAVLERRSLKPKADAPPAWRSVVLLPFSDDQIRQMAILEGVNDPDRLLADIRRRHAEEYARRPQDLIELCADWRDHHSIRTHRKQVAHNIEIKLKPRTDRKEKCQLSPDKAFEGASRLALAALLTRKLTLRHSPEADRTDVQQAALDPQTILHDWTLEERETLLERALFGFASYGRVRFHHRSVVEYLAAARLKVMLDRGVSIKSVKRLLLTETAQAEMIVKPSMQPVAAWLALESPSIFESVRDRAPGVLLNGGDPESLQLAQRASVLTAYVERHGNGGWRGLHVPWIQVHRLASPDLAPEVLRLWLEGIENPEVRELLLELIVAGEMRTCVQIAYESAIRPENGHAERIDAIEALAALKDPRLDEMIVKMQSTREDWPTDLVWSIVLRLFPEHLGVDRLCDLLSCLVKTRRSATDISWHLPKAIADADLTALDRDRLRHRLTQLVMEGLVWSHVSPKLSSPRNFLVPTLLSACICQWKAGVVSPELMHSSVVAIQLTHHGDDNHDLIKMLRELLAASEGDIRRQLFWVNDAFLNSFHAESDPWKRYVQAVVEGPIQLSASQDGAWVESGVADRSMPLPERALILELAIVLWDNMGDWKDHLTRLRTSVTDAPELMRVIDERLKPKSGGRELRLLEAKDRRRRKQAERRNAKAHASWVAFWREVARDPDRAFDDAHASNTTWNLWEAMRRTGKESRASGWNRPFIESNFGKPTADRLRSALSMFWRKESPPLRSERTPDDQNKHYLRWDLGVAAIYAEAEDPLWAQQLSPSEARLAARFALLQFNGTPSWIESLAQAHPTELDAVLGNELDIELAEVAASGSYSMILQNLSHATKPVGALFSPRLRKWLDEQIKKTFQFDSKGQVVNQLGQLLNILLGQDDPAAALHLYSLAVAELASGARDPAATLWLAVMMQVEPRAGVEKLEELISGQTAPEKGDGILWLAQLFGDMDHHTSVYPGNFEPDLLLRLVRLAYRTVRRNEDADPDGDVPMVRDNAERGRSLLLKSLLEAKGPEAWKAKLALADDPMFAHFRDRAIEVARERSAEEADGMALDEQAIITLDRHSEAPPMTRADMFALMMDRLDDVDDLLLQDISPRGAWARIDDETIMRREIARALRDSSNHAYTVDQEAATADEKETDIRLRSAGSEQQAVIELKIGEKDRSASDLRKALKEQLVTKYMAASGARSGCFLITVVGDRQWQHPDTHLRIDLDGLITMLNEEAAKITADTGGDLRLAAKGLDLRPRLPVERPGRKQQGRP